MKKYDCISVSVFIIATILAGSISLSLQSQWTSKDIGDYYSTNMTFYYHNYTEKTITNYGKSNGMLIDYYDKSCEDIMKEGLLSENQECKEEIKTQKIYRDRSVSEDALSNLNENEK